jgi:hypothetical protein
MALPGNNPNAVTEAVAAEIKAAAKADAGSFREVAENFIKRHVETHKLRSEGEVKRFLAKYFLPLWEGLVLALRFEPRQAAQQLYHNRS